MSVMAAGNADNKDVAAAREAVESAKQISQEAFTEGMRRLLMLIINGYPRALRSTAARRNELLRKHGGSQDAAEEDIKAQAAAVVEETKSWVLGLVPFVGLPASVLYPAWRALRRVCLLAGVYGHDLQAEVTHAKILHVFGGIRAVPAAEFLLEKALQALWVAFTGPVAAFVPVGALASKLVNVEGHVVGVVGKETFLEGSQLVPPEVYMQELDPEPTHQDYLSLAQDGAYVALGKALGAGFTARDVLLDDQRRQEAIDKAIAAAGEAKGKAVVLTKGAVAAAPGVASQAAAQAPEAAAKAMEKGKSMMTSISGGLLGKKKM